MKSISPPNIFNNRTVEQNIQSIRGWGNELANDLTYQLSLMESEIEELRKEIESLKEAQNGV